MQQQAAGIMALIAANLIADRYPFELLGGERHMSVSILPKDVISVTQVAAPGIELTTSQSQVQCPHHSATETNYGH